MKLTAAYILRLLKSPALYIGVAGCALIALWGIISEGNFTSAEAFVQYIRFAGTAQLFSDMMDFGTYRKLILIAACMPFTAAFCTEFKSGLSKQIILRSSQKNYILTHAVLNFLCTFFVSFLGIVLCVLALSLFFPLIGSLHNEYSDTFGRLLNNENTAWPFILLKSLFFSVSLGAWSVSGAAISTLFPDPFIAVCTPLIMSYIIELVTIEAEFLPDLWNLSRGYVSTADGIFFSSLEILLVFLVLAFLFGTAFYYIAKRRLDE